MFKCLHLGIPSKESIETVEYLINVLLQNSNNTIVEQISGDFALEHKFTSFSNKKLIKKRTFSSTVPFLARIGKMWISLWSINVLMAKFIVKNVFGHSILCVYL